MNKLKVYFFSCFAFFLIASFAQGTKKNNGSPKYTVRSPYDGKNENDTIAQWKVVEIRLTSSKTYANPFEDVEVTATFTGPDGKVINRPAFWDGGNIWRIRFAPTAIGVWKMTTSCNDKTNVGLNNRLRSITCKPYAGNLDIYKHGFLKVSENKRYFEYEDGLPFFYLGDTHWLYIHERFGSSNVKGIPSEFKYILDKRVNQGFTVYQTEAIQHPHGQNSPTGGGSHAGKDEEPHCNFRDGVSEADLPGFANIDRKFKYIADKGLVHANSSVCWALDPAEYPESYSEHYMYELGRYWSARYGAYPVLWTIAQEIDRNMYGKYDSITIKKWLALAAGIAENDDYHHPLTAHMENTESTIASTSWWGDKAFHRWWAIQWQGDMTDIATAKDFWFHPDTKPGILYESPYEDFWTDAKGARGTAYKAFQYGIYGYGYGANGVWNDLYSKDPADYGTDYEMPARFTSWYDGANLLGASQLRYFKKFYTSVKWWQLIPRFDDGKWSAFVDKKQALVATDEQRTFVIYFFNKVRATGNLKNLEKDTGYTAKWYNPRNGIYTIIGDLKSVNGTWAVPYKPDTEDWILLITKK